MILHEPHAHAADATLRTGRGTREPRGDLAGDGTITTDLNVPRVLPGLIARLIERRTRCSASVHGRSVSKRE
jgi:hypothetical protein